MPTMQTQSKPSCQFYGFHVSVDKTQMVDSCDSSCGLECNSHSPCLYTDPTEHGHGPDWASCAKSMATDYVPLVNLLNQAQVTLSNNPEPISMWDWRRMLSGNRQSAAVV